MDIIASTFQKWKTELAAIPESVLSKFQRFFYCLFPLVSLACVVLTVTTHRTDAVLVIIAILSALYEGVMCCCCIKKQIKLGYGIWLHTGVALILFGFIALEFMRVAAAIILLCVGFLFILVVSVCVCLGHDVLVERNYDDFHFGSQEEQNWV